MAVKNLIQLLERSCDRHEKADCLLTKQGGGWQPMSWGEFRRRVRSLSAALQGLGVKTGDRIAILSSTRAEWTLADMAIIGSGGITIPIYQSNLPEEVAYILKDSEARGIFVEDRNQLAKISEIKDQVPGLEFIVLMSGKGEAGVVSFDEWLKTDPDKATLYSQNKENLDRDTVASLVYTSGTTGQPKGAILTHGNFIAETEACQDVIEVHPGDVSLSFLPLAHILARAVQFYHLASGFTMAYAESIERLGDNLQSVRPHFLVSVPRIFEKVYERIISQVHASSSTKQKLFHWAQKVGHEYSLAKQKGEPPSVGVSMQYLLASRLVFSKIQERLGGRMVFAVSGGAPLAKEIAEFFHAAGILILEGYGLTETTAAINCVRKDRIEFGVVGPPVHNVEEKIAEDGEILVKGPVIFKGYYKNEEATREVLTADGWFHTGDIGEFTAQGSLKITDRKKDIIVTAGGKNIAPQKIENIIKLNKYISQVVVHGDKKKYLTALITLSPDEIKKFAQSRGIENNGATLAKNTDVHKMVKQVIDESNQQLPPYETIKRFAILDRELTQEDGEVTPSLKVKRRFVVKKYADILHRLYEDAAK